MTKKVKISEGKTTEVKFEMLDYAGSLEQQFKSSRLLFLASFVGAGYSTYLLGEASASSTDAYGRYNDALSSANAVKYKKLAQKNYKKETLIKSLLASSIITTLYAGIKFASVNIENQKIKDKKELEDAIKYFGNRYNKTFKQLYMRALGSPRYSQYRFQNYIYKMDYSEHPYFGKLRDNKYIFSKGLNSSSLFEVVISSEKMIRIYLNDKKPTGVAITKRRTNIRSAPSALFPPIMKAATGSKFLVIPRVRTGWITIIFGDNGIGYVEDSDVKFLLK